jgi:TolA-binding protein
MNRTLFACILLGALAAAGTGCAGFVEQLKQEDTAPQTQDATAAKARIAEARKLMQEGKFAQAITAYRQYLQDHPSTEWSPEAKYAIASAYVSADNQQKDYAVAAVEFEEFLSQFPKDQRAGDAQNWRAMLKAYFDTRRENDRLNKTLEKLKKLDVQQEERRLGR